MEGGDGKDQKKDLRVNAGKIKVMWWVRGRAVKVPGSGSEG